ncbi:g protein-coupled receptor-related [Anaeramoeba ignava]|uniref:G protein-coupled receptor-related n=1 Tax=Anaeramoeba ignava TaxID=1746090 RepID=A0A9Q0LVX3_ANAIG|nr:g protein-coupled receptor-related [Anaeramoeba ignava]
MKKISLICILIILVTFKEINSQYVVDKINGIDTGDCTSQPCKTIGRAVSLAVDGSDITIYATGIYSDDGDCGLVVNQTTLMIQGNDGQNFPVVDCKSKATWLSTTAYNTKLEVMKMVVQNAVLDIDAVTSEAAGAFITTNNSNVHLSQCSFLNGDVVGANGSENSSFTSGIYIENSLEISLVEVDFINNGKSKNIHNSAGAGILRYSGQSISGAIFAIRYCNVENNSGDTGGFYVDALYSIPNFNLEIIKTQFVNNSGVLYGGMFFSQNNGDVNVSHVLEGNLFENNSGVNVGGFAFAESDVSTNMTAGLTDNKFVSNSGRNQAGGLSYFSGKIDGCNMTLTRNNFTANQGRTGGVGMRVYLPDKEKANQLGMNLNFWIENNGENGGGLLIKAPFQVVSLSNMFQENTAVQGGAICLQDSVSFEDFSSQFWLNNAELGASILDVSGGYTSLQLSYLFVSDNYYPNVFFINSSTVTFGSLSATCPNGSNFLPDFSSSRLTYQCEPCAAGTFSTVRGTMLNNVTCFECPQRAACFGGSDVYIEFGFWAQSLQNGDIDIYECPVDYCLPGNLNTLQLPKQGECTNNRTGLICTECAAGFTETLLPNSNCAAVSECKNQVWQYVLLLLPKVFLLVWAFMYVPHASTPHFHIVVHFVQVLSLVLPAPGPRADDFFWSVVWSVIQLFDLQTALPIFRNFGACPAASMTGLKKIFMQFVGPLVFFGTLLPLYIFAFIRKCAQTAESDEISGEESSDSQVPQRSRRKKVPDEIELSSEDNISDKDSDLQEHNGSPSKIGTVKKIKTPDFDGDLVSIQWHSAQADLLPDSQQSAPDNAPQNAIGEDPLNPLSNDQDPSEISETFLDRDDIRNLGLDQLDISDSSELYDAAEKRGKTSAVILPANLTLIKRLNLAFWTVFLLAYFVLVKTSFDLVSCISINVDNNYELRLYRDASVKCYSAWQIVFFVILGILLFVPFILLISLTRSSRPKVNGTTVLSLLYEPFLPSHYYYAPLSLFVRFCLVAVAVLITNSAVRTFVISLFCVLFLSFNLLTRPFVSSYANWLNTATLSVLCLAAGLGMIHASWQFSGLMPYLGPIKNYGYGLDYSILSLCSALFLYFLFRYVRLFARHRHCFGCK